MSSTPPLDGLLVIDKPAGPTSHDVVQRVRRALGERRVGHTGTLDPGATGVLPLVLGRATRLARFLSASEKAYDAVVCLGIATDTYDSEGTPVGPPHAGPWPSHETIVRVVSGFRGPLLQQPPAFSAKKIAGVRSYVRARSEEALRTSAGAGHHAPHSEPAVLPKPAAVTAHRVDVVGVEGVRVQLRIECSAGFYVRSLAHEIGVRLGTGAHLEALRRLRSGWLDLSEAISLDAVEQNPQAARAAVMSLDAMLPSLSTVVLTEEGARRAAHGRDLGPNDAASGAIPAAPSVRLVDRSGRLLGIGVPGETSGLLHPSIVLV
jgi:tRNA pseudouridine55 synthase